MKDHAKVGNRPGNPAYRTPSQFKNRENLDKERLDTKKSVPKKKPYRTRAEN